MRLKENGARLVGFVADYVSGEIERWEFDLDYSHNIIEYFPKFEQEHPRLARRFADTVDRAYDNNSRMSNEQFRDEISHALDVFMGKVEDVDLI